MKKDYTQKSVIYTAKNSLCAAVLKESLLGTDSTLNLKMFKPFHGKVLSRTDRDIGTAMVTLEFKTRQELVALIDTLQNVLATRDLDTSRWIDPDERLEEKRRTQGL